PGCEIKGEASAEGRRRRTFAPQGVRTRRLGGCPCPAPVGIARARSTFPSIRRRALCVREMQVAIACAWPARAFTPAPRPAAHKRVAGIARRQGGRAMTFANATMQRDSVARINITPLVDVLLVLLVIFMIAAPVLARRIPLALPGSAPPAAIDTEAATID